MTKRAHNGRHDQAIQNPSELCLMNKKDHYSKTSNLMKIAASCFHIDGVGATLSLKPNGLCTLQFPCSIRQEFVNRMEKMRKTEIHVDLSF